MFQINTKVFLLNLPKGFSGGYYMLTQIIVLNNNILEKSWVTK